MGKSTSVQGQKARIDEEISGKGDISLWVDLRAYQTDVRLIQAIFDAPVFKSWLSGSQNLHLFLDSLDECLLRIDTVAALLVEELPKYPIDCLHLRIALRIADWPTTLEQGLMRLWGDEAFKVYELAPLRRVDIIEAAKTNRVEPGGFLTEIVNREVVPLAIKPVTLQFLLNTYNRHGQFPKTQSELYLEGCRLLCEETSDSRRANCRVPRCETTCEHSFENGSSHNIHKSVRNLDCRRSRRRSGRRRNNFRIVWRQRERRR